MSANINELENEIKQLKKENQLLKELMIIWKRKAEDKIQHRETLREGYNAYYGMHYKVYSINLPEALPITDVLDYLKANVLPDLYPYTLTKIDYVPKKKEWVFEVEFALNYDVQLEEAFLRKYYENNPG